MKTICNINLQDDQCRELAIKIFPIVREAWEQDSKGNHSEGILSDSGKVACQLFYELNEAMHFSLQPNTKSAIEFVNLCVPVAVEDCVSLIHKYIPETVNVLGETLTKAEAETVLENLIVEYENIVDKVASGVLDIDVPSSHCLAISKLLDAGIGKGKVESTTEFIIRMLSNGGNETYARMIIKLSK